MKCKPALIPKFTSSEIWGGQGGRGRRRVFPQAPAPAINDLQRPLPPPPTTATPAEQDHHRNQETIRRCVARLQWQPQDLVRYIAEQFGDRRFHQLTPDEVTLLIYRLSILDP